MILDESIKFEEEYNNGENLTLYFIASKELLNKFYPEEDFLEAVSTEISIEFPNNNIEAQYASVCISPTREYDGAYEDYDWRDIDIPYEEIEALLNIWDNHKIKIVQTTYDGYYITRDANGQLNAYEGLDLCPDNIKEQVNIGNYKKIDEFYHDAVAYGYI